jgi:hypothetical protein
LPKPDTTPDPARESRLIEAQFTAVRYFGLDGTDHASHHQQARMIRRYIIWRNNHAYDERLRRVVTRDAALAQPCRLLKSIAFGGAVMCRGAL